MDKVQFNTEVVNMRNVVKRAQILTFRSLTRQAAKLRKKKGSQQQLLKNKRRADRFLAEIEAMKDLTPDTVTRKAVTIQKTLEQVLNHSQSSATERVLARLIYHKLVQERVVRFKDMVAKDFMRMGTKKYRQLRKERFLSEANKRWKDEEDYHDTLERTIGSKTSTRSEGALEGSVKSSDTVKNRTRQDKWRENAAKKTARKQKDESGGKVTIDHQTQDIMSEAILQDGNDHEKCTLDQSDDFLERIMQTVESQSSDDHDGDDESHPASTNRGRFFDDLSHRGKPEVVRSQTEVECDISGGSKMSDAIIEEDLSSQRRSSAEHPTEGQKPLIKTVFLGSLSAVGNGGDDDDQDITPTTREKQASEADDLNDVGQRKQSGGRKGLGRRKPRKVPMVDQPNPVRQAPGEKQIPGINCHPDLPFRTGMHEDTTRKFINPSRAQSKQLPTNQSRQGALPSHMRNPTKLAPPKASETVHPSWEASRKRKAESKIVPFQGKKITFDED